MYVSNLILNMIMREGIPDVLSTRLMCPLLHFGLIVVHGGWGGWSAFSTCSKTCDGTETRERVCDSPSPEYGGTPCIGSSIETRACNTDICVPG